MAQNSFWWWLTYDALVAFVIVMGVKFFTVTFFIGLGVLMIAVVIDVAEFIVKRPKNQRKLNANLH